jgi:L-ascorbate metabolism protein UlaG (beta-lactamase superfamily)
VFSFTYFGQAAVLVNFEKHILIDPGIINKIALIDIDEVKAAYVLVTHTPIEHFGNAVTIANNKGSVLVGNNSVATQARNEGIYSYALIEIEPQTPLNIGANINITAYPLARGGFLAPKNSAFLIKSNQGTILHLGHAKEIGTLQGTKPDLLCIAIAGKKGGTFSPEAAIDAALAIQPRYVLPMSGSQAETMLFLEQMKTTTTEILPISITAGTSFTLV